MPNPKNPRRISEEQLRQLAKSVREFGDLGGFVWNRRLKRLVGAHQRQKVMPPASQIVVERTYKKPTAQGTVAEGYVLLEGERFAYREVDWPESKDTAANLAANQHGGDFQWMDVSAMLKELNAQQYDLDLLGFNPDELHNLIAGEWRPPEQEASLPELELADRLDLTPAMREQFNACKAAQPGQSDEQVFLAACAALLAAPITAAA